mgnify:CR=1 FL=1
MGSYPQKCSYEKEKVRPGYVRPGLSVDEAYRKWNMRLIRKRKERINSGQISKISKHRER